MAIDLTLMSLVLALVLNFTLGAIVLFFSQKKRSNIFFGLFCLFLGIWTATIIGYRSVTDSFSLFFWMKAAYISALYIGVFFFFFSRTFPYEEKLSAASIFFHLAGTILFSFIIGSTGFVVHDLRKESWGVATDVDPFGWTVYAVYFLSYFLSAHFYLFAKYLKTEGLLKKQLLYLFLAVFLGGEIFGVFFNLILPSPIFNEWRHIWIGPTLTALIVVPTITYAIAKYQVMDVKLAITQILVAVMVIFSFLDIFLYRTVSELILRAVIFVGISAFGYLIIRSVLNEIRRREQLARLNADLQKADELLREQNEKLKELDKAKSEFISVASHQLRTPLTATRWALDFLVQGEKGKLNAAQREAAHDLQDQNFKLIKLVNELLNVSRLEESRVAITPTPVDLVALIKSLLKEFAPIAKHMSIEVVEEFDPLPRINLDEGVITKCFHNLISNAIKYNREGKHLWVTIRKEETDALITVRDEGIGIPASEQDKLFVKFYRASNASASHTEGTGLGLYIVKKAIELCGGKIWFESAQDVGTTFFVILPLAGCKEVKGEKTLS